MKSSAVRSATTAVLAAILVLIAGSDAGPGVAADTLLQARHITIKGSTVELKLVNSDDQAVTETVRVRAISAGKMMTASTVVTVAAGKTVTVGIQFPAPVRGIIDAGVILDDGAPF